MSAASKGAERQAFIESFLTNVLPPTFRFGSGDATDAAGHRSGQLDVVVEYPFSPSLPSFGGPGVTRLYLAESSLPSLRLSPMWLRNGVRRSERPNSWPPCDAPFMRR